MVIIMVLDFLRKKEDEEDILTSYARGEEQEQKPTYKRTSEETGMVLLALSVILSAIMIYITSMLITPFLVDSYKADADIVPVAVTYLVEGVLVFFGVYISVMAMKIRGVRFRFSSDLPYIAGASAIAIIVVNMILYYMDVDLQGIQELFGGYGLAMLHATVGSITSSYIIRRKGHKISPFNLTVVSIMTTIILFVLAHMIIPETGLADFIMF